MEKLYSAVVTIADPETLKYYKPLTNNQKIIVKILNDDQIIISDNISFENELIKLNCEKKILKDETMTLYQKPSSKISNINKFDIQVKNGKIVLAIYIAGHLANPIEIKGDEI